MVGNDLDLRQIWATPFTKSPHATATLSSQAQSSFCTVALPSGGVLSFNDSYALTLSDAVTFYAACEDHPVQHCREDGNSTVIKSNDPFYASLAPNIYALATATIISYILVILIFITPRTFYVGSPGGGASFLGLRNLVPGSGSSSVVGVGRRPLLQKVAAVTVAISLTIATADTFHVAERQYNNGLMDSQHLVDEVIGSLEIRVVRVISDTFLWLAQVQTLIRLFPRHKEKVTIKWLGFALVTCDTVFSILENFVSQTTLTRPRSFQDAIPALSYLFQMAISLIYASCVIYYSLSKRRFAFWHSKMKNILLVAFLSLTSVLIPVVFFVLDVSQPNIATWGEYIRWVGAAAASVVVWEWVERIEALERDERKEGILGREIFDGDEMLDVSPSGKNNSRYFGFGRKLGGDEEKKVSMMPIPTVRPRIPFRKRKGDTQKTAKHKAQDHSPPENENSRPPQNGTPISRSDTTSAASTIYAVRYQNVSSPSPAIHEEPLRVHDAPNRGSVQVNGQMAPLEEVDSSLHSKEIEIDVPGATDNRPRRTESKTNNVWQAVQNPFKRKRTEPPAEIAAQMATSNMRRSPAQTYHNLRDRLGAFTTAQRNKLGNRPREGPSPPMGVTVIPAQPRPSRSDAPARRMRRSSTSSSQDRRSSRGSRLERENLPVTIIPAPIRGGRTWSPDDLKDDEESHAEPGSQDSDDDLPLAVTTVSPSSQVTISRGALTISESPMRHRDQTHRSSAGPGSPQISTRLRGPTIDSLNDRLSSVSPGTASAQTRLNEVSSTEQQNRDHNSGDAGGT